MLLPKTYRVEDSEEIANFVDRYSFATVVSGLQAAHVPLLFDSVGQVLVGHLTASNPVISEMKKSGQALAIFQGPHGYVSSSWYVDKTIPPTWNFTAVHALGRAVILDSDDAKLAILQKTVAHYERMNQTSWSFSSEDPEIRGMLPLITGFEIQVESLQCCYKLSQNRKAEDLEGALRGLELKGDEASMELARWMRTKASKVQSGSSKP